MEVKTAKSAGFCFGVKRAVEKVYEVAGEKESPVYTYGPIIHNEEVVGDLEKRGVSVLNSEEELLALTEGTVIIRSHGVPKKIYQLLREKGLDYVDVTCPFVLKIHRIVERESRAGRHIVIIGNRDHPEVEGIRGWCDGPSTVIKTREEAENFLREGHENVCIVSQTTFNYNKFQEIVEILAKKRYDRLVLNTICNATNERQAEAAEIAKTVDAMIVIGGKHSSNTQKLFEICKGVCKNTYFIQTLADLDSDSFRSIQCVGITAGASTPNKIIEEVSKHVRIKF
ncbi:4-hydroxy-3-methylbut-2-enyl diphosphate reductase [Blautia producta]|uniref:4-hydroxy-3-methylbut-2-enyl diphosphate reductase n=1 Tax=Blautia producta TaxID=33035 RepID=UPI0035BE7EBE